MRLESSPKNGFSFEKTDPAAVPGEVGYMFNSLEALYGPQRHCLKVFGYTKAMITMLSKPIVWHVRGKMRSIGMEGGPPEDMIQRCLDRMRTQQAIVQAVIAVEFPSFEVDQAGLA